MSVKEVPAADLGLPSFEAVAGEQANVFALSSHQRAKAALAFGLATDKRGFNIFVVGEDRSNRMTATLAYLRAAVVGRALPDDWLYLNNFRRPHRPKPYRVPAGVGAKFRDRMVALTPQIRSALKHGLEDEAHQAQLRTAGEAAQREVVQRMDQVRQAAAGGGLHLHQTPQGVQIAAQGPEGKPLPFDQVPAEQRAALEQAAQKISGEVAELNRWAAERQSAFLESVSEANRQVAENAIGGLLDNLIFEYQGYQGLTRWLVEMRVDILDHLQLFLEPGQPQADQGQAAPVEVPEGRYAVNLLVDNADAAHPPVLLEANPSYENLFGRIEYRATAAGLQTDFSMIRSGALHRANGGILVLRADALAAAPLAWSALKSALRDRVVRLEELHRSGAVPMSEAPRPKAIPLDLKVVIVGAPRWYYTFFSADPEFASHFKIKADIDADMDASPENLACYAALIRDMAQQTSGLPCDADAQERLLGLAALWAERRDKLTAQVELLRDVLSEAAAMAHGSDQKVLTGALIAQAQADRLRRNARAEDHLQAEIARGTIMIDTTGQVIGQINGLTVRSVGDHVFGAPARITARAFLGRRGIINIERDVAMGGPIQQKGAMVLQGFLAGHFARRIPLSFNCSITFEQSYGGVEGDSASLAELLAVLSDLASIPLRQDLAITGSVNQRGQSQAVGGVRHKVAGFFRACQEAGGLNGSQGVVLPAANAIHLLLPDPVVEAVQDGNFHVYGVTTVEQAIELFTGMPAGEPDAEGGYPEDSVYGRVFHQLEAFDRILGDRNMGT